MSAQAGGYVLAGVLCFALGVVFALVCQRIRIHRKEETKEEELRK